MRTAHIVVVTAGLSEPSTTALLGEQLRQATAGALNRAGIDARFTVISLRSLAKDITHHHLTGFPAEPLDAALKAVNEADAIIAVTPVFKFSKRAIQGSSNLSGIWWKMEAWQVNPFYWRPPGAQLDTPW